MSTDSELKVLLTADAAQLQAGMEAGAASVQQSVGQMQATVAEEAAAFNAAVQAKIDAMMRLNVAFAGNLTSAEGVTEAESALDQAMAAGAISAGEQAAFLDRLTAAQVESTVAVEANTVATINSRTAYSASALITDALTGQYSRMNREVGALANETGVMSSALGFILSPLGLVTIAVGILAAQVFEAGQRFDAMEGAVLATGDAAGFTAGQLVGMAQDIGQSSGNIGLATEAVQKLALSGRFAGQDLKLVAQAATDMAVLTGQSIQATVAQIDKLQEDPVKAVAKLNDQYHFLTVAQFKEIEAAQQSGDSMRAASIAYEAMADKMQGRTDQLSEHVNILVRGFHNLKQVWSETTTELNHALGGGDSAYALNEAKLLLGILEKQKQQAQEMGSSILPSINLEITNQKKKVTELTAEFAKTAHAAASVGQAAQQSASQIDAMAHAHKKGGNGASAGSGESGLASDDMQLFREMQLNRTMSLQQEKNYWQQKRTAATEGTAEYRQAVEQLLQIKNKEATAGQAETRKEVEDAKRGAAERVRAEKEVEREKERAAEKARQLSLQKLKDEHDEATRSIANSKQQYQEEYANGQINAAQLLQLESDLMTQKLAADRAYYEAKAKLDAAAPLAVEKDNAAIVKSQQDALATMLRNEKEFHVNSEKQWNTYAKQIEGAVQGAVNGMLFQHQTLRQGLGNIALVIGEDFIKNAVMKPVNNFIEGEATKTAAAIAGATQRAIVEQTAAKASIVADAATGKSQITSAAATGAAKAYQAIVGIPIVGPILAPIAAGVAFAGIEAFGGKLSSAQGGWERVPIDGMMTQLHKDEMVLPAPVADHVRNSMGGRGGQTGNGEMHNHFHSFDSKGIADYARRRPAEFAAAMKHVAKRGHLR